MQGLIVRSGNPKNIAAVGDLCRPDVRMVNRQRGSGTRALLEFMISSENLDRGRMRGYEDEETTHGAVAALIAGNQADVGFGVMAAASQYRLEFIPLCLERYFLACRADEIGNNALADLLQILGSAAFRDMVATLPGYSAEEAGEVLESFEQATTPTP